MTALPSHEAFLLGAAAKAISTLVTYPLQLAQAKLRWGRNEVRRERSDIQREGPGVVAFHLCRCFYFVEDTKFLRQGIHPQASCDALLRRSSEVLVSCA